MDEIAHIEEFLWEFSDLDRQRYFESEGEWMTYAIQTTFSRFSPLLKPKLRDCRACRSFKADVVVL